MLATSIFKWSASEKSINIYQTTESSNPEDRHLQTPILLDPVDRAIADWKKLCTIELLRIDRPGYIRSTYYTAISLLIIFTFISPPLITTDRNRQQKGSDWMKEKQQLGVLSHDYCHVVRKYTMLFKTQYKNRTSVMYSCLIELLYAFVCFNIKIIAIVRPLYLSSLS